MSKFEEKYQKLVERRLATKDKEERNRIFQETRAMERESARNGRVLEAIKRPGGKVALEVKETSTKRSLQEEYVRKFDGETQVMMAEPGQPDSEAKKTTLRKYHQRRLLGR